MVQGQKKKIKQFDPEFRFLLNLDPALECWRALAAEYWAGLSHNSLSTQKAAITAFFVAYLHHHGLHTLSVDEFFTRNRELPDLEDALGLVTIKNDKNASSKHDSVVDFLDWILQEKFCVVDTDGYRVAPSHLANPFQRKSSKNHGKTSDLSFSHLLKLDPKLEDWRQLAEEWLRNEKSNVSTKRDALDKFLTRYIFEQNLDRNYGRFLLRDNVKPHFNQLLVDTKRKGMQGIQDRDVTIINYIADFLDWVLANKLGDPDKGEWDRSRFHNPIQRLTKSGLSTNTQSDKASLSIRFIRELRGMLAEGRHFRDWKWAQQAMEVRNNGGEWFRVDPEIVNLNDPDCVARHRAATSYEITKKGYPAEVWEIWSPVRAVALYLKLELPLRTFQVRMLDSGEADTWRYVHAPGGGAFVLNGGSLAIGNEKRPYQRGVFHRSFHEKDAGLFINTNKTADINKAENEKGYVIPWANDEVLYWLEKLRNWQEKYNRIARTTPWTALDSKHFGATPPHPEVLAQRSSACFLFRDPTDGEGEKPLNSDSLKPFWYKMLAVLEQRCTDRGETLDDGTPLRFVDPNSNTGTSFPLHALRVSLISYFILDLKLPIAFVSKMIAGHATIIMTLYYTKFGKAYMREVLSEAEKNELEAEQNNHRRFIKDATFEQVSQRFAYVSEDAVKTAVANRGAFAAFVFDDKGICPNGATMCDVGGERLRVESNTSDYAPVSGYPQERNCVCCRFFLTGPAFLPGLIAHFNTVSEKTHRQSDRYAGLQDKLTLLEDHQREVERENKPFLRVRELNALNKYVEAEALILNKYMNDLQATNHLIQRSMEIAKDKETDGVKLVANGGMTDLKVGFIESQSVLHQLEVVCENAVIYPDVDAGYANIRRSQMLDAMLRYNGMEPILMYLEEEEQLLVGNAMMQLIQVRTGSIKDALPYAECRRKLKEINIINDQIQSEIAAVKAKILFQQAKSKRSLPPPKEDSHDDAP